MEDSSESDALARLEAALDRIARQRQRPASMAAQSDDFGTIASRLDVLIGQLRHALAVEA